MTPYPWSQKTRNLVRFCVHPGHEALDESFIANFGFTDQGSRFCLLKSTHTAPGPDEAFSLYHFDARRLFRKLLGLELAFPGLAPERVVHAQMYNSMNYYRSHIEEIFFVNGIAPLPPVEGICTMYHAAVDRLVIRYDLRNTSAADGAVRLRWFSEPEAGTDPTSEGAANGFRFEHTAKVLQSYRAAMTLAAEGEPLPFAWDGAAFRSPWIERRLPARATLSFVFRADFAMGPDTPERLAAGRDQSLDDRIREVEAVYAGLPSLPEPFRRFEPVVLKAVGLLRTNRYRERDARGAEVPSIRCSKCGCSAMWFWDGAFTLQALGLIGDTPTAQGMGGLLVDGITAEGKPPCTYAAGSYRYGYQQPILAWGLGHYLALRPDRAFLERCYPALARYVRHWCTAADSNGNGLAEYPAGGSCWDDSLRWHDGFPLAFAPGEAWWEKRWGAMRTDRFESVDTNTHLYLECRTMARFARGLGREHEEREWDQRAETLARQINALLFDPATGTYQDRHIVDGRFSGMLTPSVFMPLYAGIAPRDVAQAMCRRYLLDPQRFYTTLPFATLDRSHPAFRSGGYLYAPPSHPGSLVQQAYWIGRAWPHVSYWMVGALWHSGLHAEADEAAARILDAISRSESIYECYDSLTGFGNGHPEMMWSGAAVLALAYRRYALPAVAEPA